MPSLLRRLPKELRGPILKEAMRWEGSSPALLVALRGDKSDRDMYEEALGWFNATNIFSLSSVNEWSFGDLSTTALLRIRHLSIAYFQIATGQPVFQANPFTTILKAAMQAKNTRTIEWNMHCHIHFEACINEPQFFLKTLKKFLHSYAFLTRIEFDLDLYDNTVNAYEGSGSIMQAMRCEDTQEHLGKSIDKLPTSVPLTRNFHRERLILGLVRTGLGNRLSLCDAHTVRRFYIWEAEKGALLKLPRGATKPVVAKQRVEKEKCPARKGKVGRQRRSGTRRLGFREKMGLVSGIEGLGSGRGP